MRSLLSLPTAALCVLLTGAAEPTPAPNHLRSAIEASARPRGQTTFWRSEQIGLILGYDERWQPASPSPSQTHTVFVVNWTAKEGGGVMATCYVEAVEGSAPSPQTPAQIEAQGKAIADAIVRKGRQRDPNLRLVTWRAARQDNHPIVYVERELRVQSLDHVDELKVYAIVTAWRGYELVIECGSAIPRRFPEMAPIVEQSIRRLLNSVQFIRDPASAKPPSADADAREFVDAHNAVRAAVQKPANYSGPWAPVPPVTWSDEVASSAQAWAENLRDTRKCGLLHSDTRYGENLAAGKDMDAERAVRMWAGEVDNYTYSPEYEFEKRSGHYSQIVWRRTTNIGCGRATCGRNAVVVCRYSPAGNSIGKAPY